MKAKIQKVVELKDGEYKGRIKGFDVTTEPYEYLDVIIETDDDKFELRVGYPNFVNVRSQLGLCLVRFGAELKGKEGSELEIEDFLKPGLEVVFTVVNKEGKDGNTYARIVKETLRPRA